MMNHNQRARTNGSNRMSGLKTAGQHALLYVAAVATLASLTMKSGAQRRIDAAKQDSERGEVSSTTIMIAVLVALAVVVGGLVTQKITAKANTIDPG